MAEETMQKCFEEIRNNREEITRLIKLLRLDTLIQGLRNGEVQKGKIVKTVSGWKARIFDISDKFLIGKVYPPQCCLGINAHWDFMGKEIHNSPMFDIDTQ